jgi:hypothetical protein
MKLHACCRAVVLCLLAVVPQVAQATEEDHTLPLKLDDVLVSEPEPGPPPLFSTEPSDAAPQDDFPVGFLKPATPWPQGVPTSAGLAPESALSQRDEAPPPPPVAVPDPMEGMPDFWSEKPHFVQRAAGWVRNLWNDQLNYYTWQNAAWIGVGLAVAAPIANTPADQHFRDWYQGRWGNNTGMNSFALNVKNMGEGAYMIPGFLAAGTLSMWLESYWPAMDPLSEWFGRTLRGWATGAPTLLLMQVTLGAGRPLAGDHGSYWKPFGDSHGASGHAFMGSMPFLTAVEMVDNPWLKGALMGASFMTPWSRIQTDDHYLSQVILGWWFAWRTVKCISLTQQEDRHWDVFPSVTPDGGAQVNVLLRY